MRSVPPRPRSSRNWSTRKHAVVRAESTPSRKPGRSHYSFGGYESILTARPLGALRCQTQLMARLIGINHVALEVGNIDEALAWYGGIFEFELRGRNGDQMAFIDMGDQFIALS